MMRRRRRRRRRRRASILRSNGSGLRTLILHAIPPALVLLGASDSSSYWGSSGFVESFAPPPPPHPVGHVRKIRVPVGRPAARGLIVASASIQKDNDLPSPSPEEGDAPSHRAGAAFPSKFADTIISTRHKPKSGGGGAAEPAGVESLFMHYRPRPLARVRKLAEKRREGKKRRSLRRRSVGSSHDSQSRGKSNNPLHHPLHRHTHRTDELWLTALTERGYRDGEAQLLETTGDAGAASSSSSHLGQEEPMVYPAVDVWRLEEIADAIRSGDYGWALTDAAETRRLAAMKLLLEEDYDELRSERVEIVTGGSGSGSSSDSSRSASICPIDAFPDVYGDLRLLRFLRKDTQQDPVSASTRFRAFMRWRQDNDVDSTVRADVEADPSSPHPSRLERIASLVPCQFQFGGGAADDDTVPALLRVGEWDTSALTAEIRNGNNGQSHDTSSSTGSITLADFLTYWTHTYESIHRRLYVESVERRKMMYIDEVCDLTGLSLRQFSPAFVSAVLKPWLRMTQLNYPETTKRIFFFNPPRIINVAWNIVTPLASPGTVAKVRFCRGYEGTCDDFIVSGDMMRAALDTNRALQRSS